MYQVDKERVSDEMDGRKGTRRAVVAVRPCPCSGGEVN